MHRLLPPFVFVALLTATGILAFLHPQSIGQVHHTGIPVGELTFTIAIGMIFLARAIFPICCKEQK